MYTCTFPHDGHLDQATPISLTITIKNGNLKPYEIIANSLISLLESKSRSNDIQSDALSQGRAEILAV